MKSEWRVAPQHLNGAKIWRIYRLLDVDGADQPDNRFYQRGLFYIREDAEAFAKYLNEEEAKKP